MLKPPKQCKWANLTRFTHLLGFSSFEPLLKLALRDQMRSNTNQKKCSDPNQISFQTPTVNLCCLRSSLKCIRQSNHFCVFLSFATHQIRPVRAASPTWKLFQKYIFPPPQWMCLAEISVFSPSPPPSLRAVFRSNKATCLKGMKQYCCSIPFFTCQRNPLGVNFLSLHLHMTDFQGWIKSRSSGSKGWRMHGFKVNSCSWRCGAFLNLWCFFLPPSNCVR